MTRAGGQQVFDETDRSRRVVSDIEIGANTAVASCYTAQVSGQTRMLSDVAVMFAPRVETMAGRSKIKPWSHHDEYSFVNELGSPKTISTSFWDQLIQTKANADDLFSITTPHVDKYLRPSTPSFHSYGVHDASQGSDCNDSSLYNDQQGDRYKRRRMLQFTDVNPGGFAQDSPPPYECVISSPMSTTYSYSSSCGDSSLSSVCSGDDYMLQPHDSPTFPTSPWFPGSYNTTSFKVPNAQQPVDRWASFNANQSYSDLVQMESQVHPSNIYIPNSLEETFSPPAWKRQSPPTPQSNFSLQQHKPPQMQYQMPFPQAQMQQEVGVLQSPLTPFSKPPIPPGQKPSPGPSRFKTKSPIPVALPFAMLKPSTAQGDVTLNDINKLLLSPPPTPGDRLFSANGKKPPSTLPWTGLSRKSVVTCTKIHTEGAGTITIMRTKG